MTGRLVDGKEERIHQARSSVSLEGVQTRRRFRCRRILLEWMLIVQKW